MILAAIVNNFLHWSLELCIYTI